MLIPVQGAQQGVPEWALVEMQGVIERKDGPDGEPNLEIGTMIVPTNVRAAYILRLLSQPHQGMAHWFFQRAPACLCVGARL